MVTPNTVMGQEASWALATMACDGDRARLNYIVGLNAIPVWVDHLTNGSDACKRPAVVGLLCVAGGGAKFRSLVLTQNIIPLLLDVINRTMNSSGGEDSFPLMWTSVQLVSSLVRHNPPPPASTIASTVPMFAMLLQHSEPVVALQAIWAISHIADGPQGRIQLVVDSGALMPIVSMLSHESDRFRLPALKSLGCVCYGSEQQCQAAVDAGCLPPLILLLAPTMPQKIRREAIWILLNISAGSQSQIQALIDAQLAPVIVSTIGHPEPDVKKGAMLACANMATNGSFHQTCFLVECGAIHALCSSLSTDSDMPIGVLTVCLDALLTIYRSGAEHVRLGHFHGNPYVLSIAHYVGDLLLDSLVNHSDVEVRRLTFEILLLVRSYPVEELSGIEQ
eukprot:GILI01022730.1.p1 GENE.GILI01022730.1~~GILI01022730.1.p1  ORF type:complete len:415 (-),score=30.05 GILI01022730.1:189-1367(-)